MNNKGFTMIELLASMVLLSILMIVAVPTVLRVMDDSRRTTIVNDSKKFVSNVEYKLKNNNNYIRRPKRKDDCILLTLGYLDLGSEFKEGPHGGTYSLDDSFVVVKLKSLNAMDALGTSTLQAYDFYVTLVENYENNASYGLYMVSYDELNSRNAKGYVNGLAKDKLFTKKDVNPRELEKDVELSGSGNLGCNFDLKNDSNRIEDKVYDTNDALREQGVKDIIDP